ncbi:MAG TPA: cytochrome c [Oscillospiraceae bacterium]|nr:cytochrome c [Oscillospiraceae bacterium]
MKRTEVGFLVITLATLGGFALLIYYSLVQVTPPMPPAAVAGSELWQEYGCMECHAILSSGGYSAFDLTKIASQLSEKELREFFAQPPHMPPHSKRIHVSLTEREADEMIAYLRYVSEIDTRNWPPPPVVEEMGLKERKNK